MEVALGTKTYISQRLLYDLPIPPPSSSDPKICFKFCSGFTPVVFEIKQVFHVGVPPTFIDNVILSYVADLISQRLTSFRTK